MVLPAGTQLGIYEVLEPIGSGAMGQVYRARDTRLDRQVAVKVLPTEVADDEQRLARFEREAKSLASLNHPNIAQIYAVDHRNETHFLSLEFVPGESLDVRLARGPLPLEEALRTCRDIAAGLEAAHEAGVIHRDLKPANVRVTPAGVAKVLDFGLAKPRGMLGTEPKTALTVDNRLLGTPTYMSPEQTEGKPIDRRVDVWAFGCVLYECLTGKRAFDADSLGALFARIATESVDLERLDGVPEPVQRLLERCLRKDPKQRLRDIGDARLFLEDVLAGRFADAPAAAADRPTSRVPVLAALLLGLVLGGLAAWGVVPGVETAPAPAPEVARYSIALPPPPATLLLEAPSGSASPMAISPDGRKVVFAAVTADGSTRQLYLRSADESTVRPLEGTENAESPYFSHDGKHVVFSRFGGAGLHRLNLADGSIRPILESILVIRGASWGRDDVIVYADTNVGLFLIPEAGGERKQLTGTAEDEHDHRWPQILPGGKRVLFTVRMLDRRYQPRILSLETGEVTALDVQGAYARYVAGPGASTGFLLYMRSNDLWAVRFDPAAAKPLGDPVHVVTGIHVSDLGSPHIAVAASGVLVYEPLRPPSPGKQLVWVDREGNRTPLHEGMGYEFPSLSPGDPNKIIFANHTDTASHDVWMLTIRGDRVVPKQITTGHNLVGPRWSPTDDRIVMASFRRRNLWIMDHEDAKPRELLDRPNLQLVLQWHAKDRVLFHERTLLGRANDVFELNLEDGSVRELLATVHSELAGAVSPRGKWLAYVSDETGRFEVYVRQFEPMGPKEPVSVNGGVEPVWSKDGRELFFRRGPEMFTVEIPDAPGKPIGEPKLLFKGPFVAGFNAAANYDVATDGRFLMVEGGSKLTTGRLDVHLHFDRELEEALSR